MKWLNSDIAEFVPSSDVKRLYPQVLIQFYQEQYAWYDTKTDLPVSNSNK